MKQCKTCGETKEFSLFTKSRLAKDGHKNSCKSCVAFKKREAYRLKKEAGLYDPLANKDQMLKKIYGIDIDVYMSMLKKQNHCCAVCGTHETVLSRKLAVDHNHTTGKIRGLLCHHCNTAIGLLKEDTSIFKDAVSYLEHHNSKEQ